MNFLHFPIIHKMLPPVGVLLVSVLFANFAHSEPYRLVPGDRIEVRHTGVDEPAEIGVNLDGQIRLSNVGGIRVVDQTLDQVEATIETAIEGAELFVDPQVSVVVMQYAPIVVVGDVAQPGRFEYLPGLSVAGALALSGGSQAQGVTLFEVERVRVETEGQLRSLNLEIAAAVVRMARVDAALAGQGIVTLSASLRRRIPAPEAIALDVLLQNEAAYLANDRKRVAELTAFWAEEIAAIEAQRKLFADRIFVQRAIVQSAAEGLKAARELEARGLQTSTRLATVEQRDADARSRALDLQSALITATQAISNAQREQALFLSTAMGDNLAARQAVQVEIEGLSLRYGRALERLGLLTGGNIGALLMSGTVDVTFTLQSPRLGRADRLELSETTLLLPGDTLIVNVTTAGSDADG